MIKALSKILNKIVAKDTFSDDFPDQFNEDYIELETEGKIRGVKSKIKIRPFIIEDFIDIKPALDSLREGYTIALLNIKPLKDKDMIELKRAVSKIKKTCEAIDGDIAGFGENWLVATPSFATIHREDDNIEDIKE